MRKLAFATALLLASVAPASANYYGEVAAFAFKFCPKDWAPAEGQLMRVYQNTEMFSLLQREYGSEDSMSFRLPELHEHPPTLPAEGARDRGKLTWCIHIHKATFPPRPE